MDKLEYDRPDDAESKSNKTLIFLLLGLAVVAIFYFGIYR